MQSLGSRLATIVAGRAVLPASRRFASRSSAPPKPWLNAGASAAAAAAAAPAGSKGLNRSVSTFEARQAVMARRTGVSISLARRSKKDVKGAKTTVKATAKPRKAHNRKGVYPASSLTSQIARAAQKYALAPEHEHNDVPANADLNEPESDYPEGGPLLVLESASVFANEKVFDPPPAAEYEAERAQAEELALNFDDATTALKSKSTWELLRAYGVLQLCAVPFIVANGRVMYDTSRRILGGSITDKLVDLTFFGHFCGGVDEPALQPVLTRMRSLGVGAILDYAAENDVASEKKSDRHDEVVSARTYDYVNEQICDINANMVMNAIDAAANALKGDRVEFAAMKVTAFGKPELLERCSDVIRCLQVAFTTLDSDVDGMLSPDEIRNGFKELKVQMSEEEMDALLVKMDFDQNGMIDFTEFMDALSPLDEAMAPLFTSAISPLYADKIDALEKGEIEQLMSMVQRLSKVAAHANEKGVSLMIDAEQTYMQPAIDQCALTLMRKYNKKRAVILNTYQCYTRDSFQRVRADVDRSTLYGYVFGAKIVRGAYMIQERRLAEQKGYPDPIQPDLESTHRNYDAVSAFILGFKSSGGEDSLRSKTLLMVASHNESSVKSTVALMASLGLGKDSGVCFGQLRGMCDHVSLSLGDAGYWVYKYVPYGPIREVMPYLLRRAEENSTLMAGAGKEKMLISTELYNRLNPFASPAPPTA